MVQKGSKRELQYPENWDEFIGERLENSPLPFNEEVVADLLEPFKVARIRPNSKHLAPYLETLFPGTTIAWLRAYVNNWVRLNASALKKVSERKQREMQIAESLEELKTLKKEFRVMKRQFVSVVDDLLFLVKESREKGSVEVKLTDSTRSIIQENFPELLQ